LLYPLAIEGPPNCPACVDFPQQHGRACHGAPLGRVFAINRGNVEALAGKPLSHQRAGDTGASDQNFAVQSIGYRTNTAWRSASPGRARTA